VNPAAQISFPFNILMALLAAAASYYLLEDPILRWRKSTHELRSLVRA
jgi:peptidoglycan/LPS O-acetylase OafA/YrhL